jgi:poly(A) polymerase
MMESDSRESALVRTPAPPPSTRDELADIDDESTIADEDLPPPEEESRPVKVIHHPISSSLLDSDAVAIIHRLSRHGHRAYLVGGCVRDLLLGRKPKDFDVGTTARPRQVKRLFRNCRIIGRRFRLAHVYFGDKIIEVSTFRRGAIEPAESNREDILVLDENVFGTPEEDAFRRDFTVNGLFYDVEASNILDHVEGTSDIERRIIRTIGDPEVRLREDPVRILRALKFAARLDLQIEPVTLAAIVKHRDEIHKSAKPRVLEEVLRLFRGGAAARSFELLRSTRVLEVVLPDVHATIERQPEGFEILQKYLAALDHLVQRGHDIPAPVAFATLVLPFVDLFGPATSPDRQDWVRAIESLQAAATALAQRVGLSRNDSARLRQIGAAVRRLVPQTQKRRFTRASIARQPHFSDGLAVFEIHCRGTGVWPEEVERWKDALSRAHATGHEAPPGARARGPAAPAPTRGRRRRRRGGRRRRRRAGAVGSPASDSARPPS